MDVNVRLGDPERADSFEVERPPLVGDLVFNQIRNLIVTRRLPPGTRLSEASLAQRLHVSKTPVREALLRLRMIGVVTLQGNSLRVVLPSPELVRDAFELRANLESIAASLAAERATPEEFARIGEAAERSLDAANEGGLTEFREQDRAFHELISIASRNSLLQAQSAHTRDLCQVLRQRDVMTDQVSRVCGHAHTAIAKAMHQRDGDTARVLMHDHVTYVMARVLSSISPGAHPGEGSSAD